MEYSVSLKNKKTRESWVRVIVRFTLRDIDPLCTLSPNHCRVFHDTFILTSHYFQLACCCSFCCSTASATDSSEHFAPFLTFSNLHSFPTFFAQSAFIKASSILRGSLQRIHDNAQNIIPTQLFVWVTQKSLKKVLVSRPIYVLGYVVKYYINPLLVLNQLYISYLFCNYLLKNIWNKVKKFSKTRLD